MNRHANARQCWTICCRWPGFEPAKPVPSGHAGRTINTKPIARPRSRQTPVNLEPSAGKSHQCLRHRHNNLAGRITRRIRWNVGTGHQGKAKRRGGQYWILYSCLSPQGKSPPHHCPLAPTRHTHRFLHTNEAEPRPLDTKRILIIKSERWQHDNDVHGPCDGPRPGNQTPSITSYCCIRIQTSTNCPISLAMPTSGPAANHGLGLALCHSPTAVPSKCRALHRCWLFGLEGGNAGTCDTNPSHPIAGRLDAKSRAPQFDDTMNHEPNSKLQRPEFQDS